MSGPDSGSAEDDPGDGDSTHDNPPADGVKTPEETPEPGENASPRSDSISHDRDNSTSDSHDRDNYASEPDDATHEPDAVTGGPGDAPLEPDKPTQRDDQDVTDENAADTDRPTTRSDRTEPKTATANRSDTDTTTAGDPADSTPLSGNSDRESVPANRESGSGRSASQGVTIEDDGLVRWFVRTEDGTIVLVRDVLTSVAIVAIIGGLLFGISGVWPPLVAVESGSMEPNMERGDLIFVVDDDRFVGDDPVEGTGIVTAQTGEQIGHETFGEPGDVIIFRPDGSDHETPVIHRAEFWVEEDENWVDTKANEEFVNGESCTEIQACPATHDGFITKGDNNDNYDQYSYNSGSQTDVVKAEWITGKAQYRIPYLGHVRLTFDSLIGNILLWPPSILGSGSVATGVSSVSAVGGTTVTAASGAVTATGVTAGVAIARLTG